MKYNAVPTKETRSALETMKCY